MYEMNDIINTVINGDCLEKLKDLEDESIDCIVTDPPYGYSFMGKDWDRAVVSVDIWKECLRVMKAGSFAFIMSSPRQDVLSRMIVNLQDAGFETNFTSIYWTYASGFPKAANVSKLVDKRNGTNMSEFGRIIKQRRTELGLSQKDIAKYFPSRTGGLTGCVWNWEDGKNCPTLEEYNKLVDILKLDKEQYPELQEAEREIIGESNNKIHFENLGQAGYKQEWNITKSATGQAKKLDGSYAGFQPKPALEVIITVMKPLSEKSFVDQALQNGKGCTWLDDCRIPFNKEIDEQPRIRDDKTITRQPTHKYSGEFGKIEDEKYFNNKGRFPANLIVSDDSLNDGKIRKSTGGSGEKSTSNRLANVYGDYSGNAIGNGLGGYKDEGSYSRYFDLDKWYEAQFIICPKASASERNKGLENTNGKKVNDGRKTEIDNPFQRGETIRQNSHPTVKPLKLMSYLITMGSRENDIILDPFCGSGTTCIAAYQLHRRFIGIEKELGYVEIANKRLEPYLKQSKLVTP